MSGYRYRRTHGKKASRKKRPTRVPPKPLSYYRISRPGRCRWCAGTIKESKRKRWHQDCVEEYRLIYYPSETRRVIYQRDRGVCAGCGQKDRSWQVDHIRPLYEQKGKPAREVDLDYWRVPNLQTLCRSCHQEKSSREATARASSKSVEGPDQDRHKR